MSIVVSTPITINITSALSQVDISDYLTRYVIVGFGAKIEEDSGLLETWDTTSHTLSAIIDSGSYKDKNAKNIEMFFNMDADGDVLGLSLKAVFDGGVNVSGNFVPADINSTRQQILKQAYHAFDALKNVSIINTNNEVSLVVLQLLGYTEIVGLISRWDNENLTTTIEFDNAKFNDVSINNAQQIIISTDLNGNIDSYSNTYSSNSLNEIQEFAYKVGNFAIADIYNAELVVNAANHTSKLTNNINFDLYKEGSDTNQNLTIDNGELSINESYDFDAIKLTDASNYTQSINISDAIDVLRHIVDLESFTLGSAGYHAADVNNDDSVNISDAIAILRHIVDLEVIDTFDLIDSSGNRISELDASTLGDAPAWMLVANGDVDMSGEFGSDYVMTSDLV
jgi:hypothetical protein